MVSFGRSKETARDVETGPQRERVSARTPNTRKTSQIRQPASLRTWICVAVEIENGAVGLERAPNDHADLMVAAAGERWLRCGEENAQRREHLKAGHGVAFGQIHVLRTGEKDDALYYQSG